MPGADDFTDPVGYASVWALVAVVLPVLVVAWYAGVTWWTRDRTVSRRPHRLRLWVARRQSLRELDGIAAARDAGALSTREAHLALSATVRSFAAVAGSLDARKMNLEQLRASARPEVVAIVEAVYPPAFGPEADDAAVQGFGVTLTEARNLVAGWGP